LGDASISENSAIDIMEVVDVASLVNRRRYDVYATLKEQDPMTGDVPVLCADTSFVQYAPFSEPSKTAVKPDEDV